MQSLGAAPRVMLVVLIVLALDSRRLHALARSTSRTRRHASGGIPAGANPDQVGLTLRQIQMRIHVDWQDGGIGWDGPEILPDEEIDVSDGTGGATAEAQTCQSLPVLWKPVSRPARRRSVVRRRRVPRRGELVAAGLPVERQEPDAGGPPGVIRNAALTDSVQLTYG